MIEPIDTINTPSAPQTQTEVWQQILEEAEKNLECEDPKDISKKLIEKGLEKILQDAKLNQSIQNFFAALLNSNSIDTNYIELPFLDNPNYINSILQVLATQQEFIKTLDLNLSKLQCSHIQFQSIFENLGQVFEHYKNNSMGLQLGLNVQLNTKRAQYLYDFLNNTFLNNKFISIKKLHFDRCRDEESIIKADRPLDLSNMNNIEYLSLDRVTLDILFNEDTFKNIKYFSAKNINYFSASGRELDYRTQLTKLIEAFTKLIEALKKSDKLSYLAITQDRFINVPSLMQLLENRSNMTFVGMSFSSSELEDFVNALLKKKDGAIRIQKLDINRHTLNSKVIDALNKLVDNDIVSTIETSNIIHAEYKLSQIPTFAKVLNRFFYENRYDTKAIESLIRSYKNEKLNSPERYCDIKIIEQQLKGSAEGSQISNLV